MAEYWSVCGGRYRGLGNRELEQNGRKTPGVEAVVFCVINDVTKHRLITFIPTQVFPGDDQDSKSCSVNDVCLFIKR